MAILQTFSTTPIPESNPSPGLTDDHAGGLRACVKDRRAGGQPLSACRFLP